MPNRIKKSHLDCDDCDSKDKGIFCSLENESLTDVSDHKVTNTFKKGQTLFVEGNHPYGIYCISKGNIKLTKLSNDGKESIIRVVKSGDVLGHRSLFMDKCYAATATAMEDTEVCFIDKTFILKLMSDKPKVALSLIGQLSKDLGDSESKLSSLHQKNVRERLAELLIILKENHGEDLGKNRFKITIKLTREEMATMIGAANETLIRFITEFRENNLISQEGKYLIIEDEDALYEWAGLE